MSVIMTLSVKGDPEKLEQYAAGDPAGMQAILDSAKGFGLIAHRFYASQDGEIVVIDEWPDEESFRSFFKESGERIGAMMQAAGVTSEPQPRFLRKLETHDEYGWSG